MVFILDEERDKSIWMEFRLKCENYELAQRGAREATTLLGFSPRLYGPYTYVLPSYRSIRTGEVIYKHPNRVLWINWRQYQSKHRGF